MNLDLLATKVLRRLYFLSSNVLRSWLCPNPSYVWSRLEKGLIWKVGNGQRVNPFIDNQIPREFRFKLLPCTGSFQPTTMDFFFGMK